MAHDLQTRCGLKVFVKGHKRKFFVDTYFENAGFLSKKLTRRRFQLNK